MKKSNKVYRISKRFNNYTAIVTVKGNPVTVEFKGGTTNPDVKGGMFMTNDYDLQQAIEARKDFGSLIVLEFESLIEPKQKLESAPATTETTLTDGVPTGGTKQTNALDQTETSGQTKKSSDPTVAPEVTNGQQAKQWLSKNKGVSHKQMPNNNAILALIEMPEINVKFPNWQINP